MWQLNNETGLKNMICSRKCYNCLLFLQNTPSPHILTLLQMCLLLFSSIPTTVPFLLVSLKIECVFLSMSFILSGTGMTRDLKNARVRWELHHRQGLCRLARYSGAEFKSRCFTNPIFLSQLFSSA